MLKRFLKFIKAVVILSIISITIVEAGESVPAKFYFINAMEKFSDEYRFKGLSSLYLYDEELYVVDNEGGQIYIFGTKGEPVFQFGREKGIGFPIDIFVFNSLIYISEERKNDIEIFNMRGEKVGKIDPPYIGFSPGNMAIMEGDGFFVVDRNSLKICVFDRDGKYKYNFGGRNLFKSVSGIAVKNGKVYISVADSEPVVRVFDATGKYITGFGRIGEGPEAFSMPSGIRVDNNEIIWVVDAFKHKVMGFDIEGKKQNEFGNYGNPREDLYYPVKIDFNEDTFYVLEKGRGRVSMFRRMD